jgi:molecular chaperone GrpE
MEVDANMTDETKPNETEQGTVEPAREETPVAGEPADVEIETLRQALEKAQAEAKDYLDQLLRSRADYANYKRRTEQDKQDMFRYGNAGLMAKLLPVVDDFERAFQALPPGLEKMTWLGGIALVQRKLQLVLENEGLEAIRVEGQKFDPALHEAISYEERDDMEDGDIIAEAQKGYKLGERILRPALVRVARHVSKPEQTPATDTQNDN